MRLRASIPTSFALLAVLAGCQDHEPLTVAIPRAVHDPFGSALQPAAGMQRPSFSLSASSTEIEVVDPTTLTVSDRIDFEEVVLSDFDGISSNFDRVLRSGAAGFAERFSGQPRDTVRFEGATGPHDRLAASAAAPLASQVGNSNENVAVTAHKDDKGGSKVVSGLGPLGYPEAHAIGEGSLSVLFDSDQSELGFDIVGTNSGSATLHFFRRDGTLIATVSVQGITDRSYAFRRAGGTRDIAGFSIHNEDAGGIGYDNVRYDDGNEPPTITDINTTNDPASQNNAYFGARGQSITFSAAASDPNNDALSYTWDFGDKTATATGQSVSHAYAANGKYPVTLTVSDGKSGTATATTTATIGHEVRVTVESHDGITGPVVATFTLTDAPAGQGKYITQLTGEDGTTTAFLDDGGWLIHARNLDTLGPSQNGYHFAVAPAGDNEDPLLTRATEQRNRVGVLWDHTASGGPTSVALTPANYERLTVNAFVLSGGSSPTVHQVLLRFGGGANTDITGYNLVCQLKNEAGEDVSVLSQTENLNNILPHREGATLPSLPPGVPGAHLQRAILHTVGTFTPGTQSDVGAQDCDIRGIPSSEGFAATPVFQTNTVTIVNAAGKQEKVHFVQPYQTPSSGTTLSQTFIAEPERWFIDYIKDPFRDNKDVGDITMVSYGWTPNLLGTGPSDDFVASGHVLGETKYILQARWYLAGQEQTVKVAVAWDATNRKWMLLEKSTTPKTLPEGFIIHDPTGHATGSGAALEGVVHFRMTIPGIDQLELRLLAREEGLSDAAPNSGFKTTHPKTMTARTWETAG